MAILNGFTVEALNRKRKLRDILASSIIRAKQSGFTDREIEIACKSIIYNGDISKVLGV